MRLLPPHPHIIQMESVHKDSSVLCHSDLFDMLNDRGRFCEDEAAWIFRYIHPPWTSCLLSTTLYYPSFSPSVDKYLILLVLPLPSLSPRSVVEAVRFCHSAGVAHLDIKPENLLVSRSQHEDGGDGDRYDSSNGIVIKLADFGQAVRLSAGVELHGLVGSSLYTALEVTSGRGYDSSADVWSLGVLLYVLLGGEPILQVLSSTLSTMMPF